MNTQWVKRIGRVSTAASRWQPSSWYTKCTNVFATTVSKTPKSARYASLFLLLLLVGTNAIAALDASQQARYDNWINSLRCLVCQNQTIAESNAPLATDLRLQVESQIEAGRSDDEIRLYLTDRYGDFVLYNPPLKSNTWLLWFAPFVLLAIALGLVIRWLIASKEPT